MTIIVENISHIYSQGLPHEAVALKGISFEIEQGEFVGIIGHTGSGKSTLLQHLNGLLKPSEGTISINGVSITQDKASVIEMRKKTGLVFQYPEYQLFEETVEKDIAFGPKNLGLETEVIEQRVKMALELVGLDFEEFRGASPFELSGGQKRRVAIAGVLAMKPEVLILDEPTAGLDPKSHKETLEMIKRIHREWGIITILVSHNMDDVGKLCDRVLVMDEGKMIINGPPRQIFARGDELKDIGLSIPQPTNLAHILRAKGFDIQGTPLTIEELGAEIKEAIGRSKKKTL